MDNDVMFGGMSGKRRRGRPRTRWQRHPENLKGPTNINDIKRDSR